MLRSAVRAASAARAPFATRGLATPVKLPDLPYDFGALAPVISGEIMQARPCAPLPPRRAAPAGSAAALTRLSAARRRAQLHHSKHHAAYVANFNAALAQYAEAEAKGDVARMIALQPAIKFNGGGARAAARCGAARARSLSLPWRGSRPLDLTALRWRVPRGAGHVNHSIFWKNLCPPKARRGAAHRPRALGS